MAGLTPFQTLGPFFDFGLVLADGNVVGGSAADGPPIVIEGTVRDGAGEVLADALVEVWQADSSGRYPHSSGRQDDRTFDGFGRVATDEYGRFSFSTIKPGRVPGPSGTLQAPHLAVGLLARGLLTRLITRIYFGNEPSNGDDPVLALVPVDRRSTLLAKAVAPGRYCFDIVLQGFAETVFFDV